MRLVAIKSVQLKDGIEFQGDFYTVLSRPAFRVAVEPDLRLVVIGGDEETIMFGFENVARMTWPSETFSQEVTGVMPVTATTKAATKAAQ